MKPKKWYLDSFFPWTELSPDANVVVLGAWLGGISIYFAEKTSGRVIAVEPMAENYRKMQSNFVTQGKTNIIPIPMAISDKTGKREMILTPKYTEKNSFFEKNNWEDIRKIKRVVPTITWDDLMDTLNLTEVGFCKVNIEGSEYLLLEGMTKVFPKKMIVESHQRVGIGTFETLETALKAKGFKVIKEHKDDIYCEYDPQNSQN